MVLQKKTLVARYLVVEGGCLTAMRIPYMVSGNENLSNIDVDKSGTETREAS